MILQCLVEQQVEEINLNLSTSLTDNYILMLKIVHILNIISIYVCITDILTYALKSVEKDS